MANVAFHLCRRKTLNHSKRENGSEDKEWCGVHGCKTGVTDEIQTGQTDELVERMSIISNDSFAIFSLDYD